MEELMRNLFISYIKCSKLKSLLVLMPFLAVVSDTKGAG